MFAFGHANFTTNCAVRASGKMYYYDKYNVKTEYRVESQGKKEAHYTIVSGSRIYYKNYTIDVDGNFVGGDRLYAYVSKALDKGYCYDYRTSNTFYYVYYFIDFTPDESASIYLVEEFRIVPYQGRGSLKESNIIAADGTYPDNGIHSDGFWYVKKEAVNNAPVLVSLTIEPKKVSEVTGYNTITVSGVVKDADVGDTLSIYYKVGNGSAILGTTLTANGSNQSFSFTITANSLEEGIHNIYVWANDGK